MPFHMDWELAFDLAVIGSKAPPDHTKYFLNNMIVPQIFIFIFFQ